MGCAPNFTEGVLKSIAMPAIRAECGVDEARDLVTGREENLNTALNLKHF
jgi:hypothetical protein